MDRPCFFAVRFFTSWHAFLLFLCSDKYQSPCTEYLSSPLPLSSGLLIPLVNFSIFFCFIFFIPPLLQIPPLITEGFLLQISFPSISLALLVTTVLYVVIMLSTSVSSSLRRINDTNPHPLLLGMCLLHPGFLTSQGQTSVLAGLDFFVFFRRT